MPDVKEWENLADIVLDGGNPYFTLLRYADPTTVGDVGNLLRKRFYLGSPSNLT